MKHQQTVSPAAQNVAPKSKPARSKAKGNGVLTAKDFADSHWRDEMIRKTAYYFYEARCGLDGNEVDDWLRAEAQVDKTSDPTSQ